MNIQATDQQERPDPTAQLMGITRQQLAALKPKEQVKHLLEQNKQVIAQALPRHMNPERLMRVAITSVTSVPALLECYVPTLIGGIIQCSQMGLEPNTVLGHAYLVPFWNSKKNRKDAQVIVGYKGLIDLARRSGQIVSIAAHAVYKNDQFAYEYGLEEKLRHIPADGERGDITHFYAVAHMKDGGHAFEVMPAATVKKIRDQAAKKNRAKTDGSGNPIITGPWAEHFEEMGRKTAIRRLAKYLPLSVELASAVAMGDAESKGQAQNLESVLEGEYQIDLSAEDDDEAAARAAEEAAKTDPLDRITPKEPRKKQPTSSPGAAADAPQGATSGTASASGGEDRATAPPKKATAPTPPAGAMVHFFDQASKAALGALPYREGVATGADITMGDVKLHISELTVTQNPMSWIAQCVPVVPENAPGAPPGELMDQADESTGPAAPKPRAKRGSVDFGGAT